MRKYLNYSLLIFILLSTSCDDVLEEDITDDTITVISPLENAEFTGNSVQFRWKVIEGAEEYRIQINNTAINTIILDSLLVSPVFDYILDPGSYQWRVRAENFAYQTAFSFDQNFRVISSENLENQVVVLNLPIDNLYTNERTLTFSWGKIDTASSYSFQILKVEEGTETLLFEDNLTELSINLDESILADDLHYKWQVKANNSTSSSNYYSRNLFIDTINPPAPNLVSPTIDQSFSINQEVNFSWNFDTDTGTIKSKINGTIEIASDENFSNILLREESLSTNALSNTFTTAGTYFWRVEGSDAAGNIGEFNETGKFIIN